MFRFAYAVGFTIGLAQTLRTRFEIRCLMTLARVSVRTGILFNSLAQRCIGEVNKRMIDS